LECARCRAAFDSLRSPGSFSLHDPHTPPLWRLVPHNSTLNSIAEAHHVPWLLKRQKERSRHAQLGAARLCQSVAPCARGCGRSLTGRRWRRCSHSSLTRCGRSRLGFAGAGDQHQGENGKRGTKYDCFFHSVNCFFKRRFVADRIARRI
jgi:hypothetical protein